MDTLEEVIALILIDVIKAQNLANEYSAKLADAYFDPAAAGKNAYLGIFPVPNTLLKSFEVKLSFGMGDGRAGTVVGWQSAIRRAVESALSTAFSSDTEGLAESQRASEPVVARAMEAYLSLWTDRTTDAADKVALLAQRIVDDIRKSTAKTAHANVDETWPQRLEASLRSELRAANLASSLPIQLHPPSVEPSTAGSLATITLQVDMRGFQVGFEERSLDGDPNTRGARHLVPKG